ncbi:hypothetical protein HanRHA438_Chr02g0052961 [Helianthus annuus]|nr:hypothetical protein HanRHA438_Chr02g0052961 [Helianthus annuus]
MGLVKQLGRIIGPCRSYNPAGPEPTESGDRIWASEVWAGRNRQGSGPHMMWFGPNLECR